MTAPTLAKARDLIICVFLSPQKRPPRKTGGGSHSTCSWARVPISGHPTVVFDLRRPRPQRYPHPPPARIGAGGPFAQRAPENVPIAFDTLSALFYPPVQWPWQQGIFSSPIWPAGGDMTIQKAVSYTHIRAHETVLDLV